MHFNLFSYVIIVILICIFIKDFNKPLESIFKHVLLLALVVSFNTNLGSFFQTEGSSAGYMFVFNIILAAIGIFLMFSKKHYESKVLKLSILAVLSVMIGLFGTRIRPYTGGIITDYDIYVGGDSSRVYELMVSKASYQFLINMVCFFIIASTIYNTFTKEDLVKSIRFILKTSGIIFMSVFVLETLGNYVLGISMAKHIFIPIFGYAHPTSINIDRYHGLFKETSHYALALFFLSLLCIIDINLTKKQSNNVKGIRNGIIRFLFFLFLLAISTSFIGILYFIICVLLYIVFNAKPKVKTFSCVLLVFAASAFLCLIVMGAENIIPKYSRFERLINSFIRLVNGEKGTFSSEGARLTSIYEMLVLVAARPFFGVGAALVDAHSTIFASLGSIGIVGTALWIFTMVKMGHIKVQHWFFVLLIIIALACAGGNGGLLEIRLLYLFATIGCVTLKPYRPQKSSEVKLAKNG